VNQFAQEQQQAVEAVEAAQRIINAPSRLVISSRVMHMGRRSRRPGSRMCDFCITGRHLSCQDEKCICIHRERQ
jgi:hypothetical protein